MSNGKELINELNYRQLIEKMPPKELSLFTALQVYEVNINLGKHVADKSAHPPNQPTKKRQLAFGGTIATAVVAGFYALGKQLGWWN